MLLALAACTAHAGIIGHPNCLRWNCQFVVVVSAKKCRYPGTLKRRLPIVRLRRNEKKR